MNSAKSPFVDATSSTLSLHDLIKTLKKNGLGDFATAFEGSLTYLDDRIDQNAIEKIIKRIENGELTPELVMYNRRIMEGSFFHCPLNEVKNSIHPELSMYKFKPIIYLLKYKQNYYVGLAKRNVVKRMYDHCFWADIFRTYGNDAERQLKIDAFLEDLQKEDEDEDSIIEDIEEENSEEETDLLNSEELSRYIKEKFPFIQVVDKAISQFRPENFEFYILMICDNIDQLELWEDYLIRYHLAILGEKKCYNRKECHYNIPNIEEMLPEWMQFLNPSLIDETNKIREIARQSGIYNLSNKKIVDKLVSEGKMKAPKLKFMPRYLWSDEIRNVFIQKRKDARKEGRPRPTREEIFDELVDEGRIFPNGEVNLDFVKGPRKGTIWINERVRTYAKYLAKKGRESGKELTIAQIKHQMIEEKVLLPDGSLNKDYVWRKKGQRITSNKKWPNRYIGHIAWEIATDAVEKGTELTEDQIKNQLIEKGIILEDASPNPNYIKGNAIWKDHRICDRAQHIKQSMRQKGIEPTNDRVIARLKKEKILNADGSINENYKPFDSQRKWPNANLKAVAQRIREKGRLEGKELSTVEIKSILIDEGYLLTDGSPNPNYKQKYNGGPPQKWPNRAIKSAAKGIRERNPGITYEQTIEKLKLMGWLNKDGSVNENYIPKNAIPKWKDVRLKNRAHDIRRKFTTKNLQTPSDEELKKKMKEEGIMKEDETFNEKYKGSN